MRVLPSQRTGTSSVYNNLVFCSVSGIFPLFHSSVLSLRVMLYRVYEDMTVENFGRMKFLLSDKMARNKIEESSVRTHTLYSLEITVVNLFNPQY